MLRLLMAFFVSFLLTGCRTADLEVKVTDNIINQNYIGNGVEWDPYDEAIAWGADLSEDDWTVLSERVGSMRMGYVRCMINSPFLYWDASSRTYDKTRNIEKLCRILRFCQDNGITVVYGEFNPPEPAMKDSQQWVEMSVDYLNHLVNVLGFDCIRHFVIFNEPDGSWASTNGDYELWKSMALRFDAQMQEYPGLKEKVSLAAPDAVVHNVHSETGLSVEDWMKMTADELDDVVGLYDVHAYPGQQEVRNGSYQDELKALKALVPDGKRIILGEAGFKYENPEDSLLYRENRRRAEEHPFAGLSDCNMMVYDHFYGLDMALLAMDVMNSGFSGMAVWMLDDAAHSVGDTGLRENIKIWGFWNILGSEAFGMPSEEEIRPWYYAWTLMCRYFPKGCHIHEVEYSATSGVRVCAAEMGDRHTLAIVNYSSDDMTAGLTLPYTFSDARVYVYEDAFYEIGSDGVLEPTVKGISGKSMRIKIPSQSLLLITDID
ncbi:MAG: hypothetical protein J6R30_06985 [Bacteroidales bacterium]|nr:hypothetical protein [Bacteroidales bacterium]